MYHLHNEGSHYEIGFTFGSRLKKMGINLLENVPFEIDQERLEFASSCLPHYEKHCPQILAEIKGLSEGSTCSYEKLCAVLFSMYCVMPNEVHCSCMALRNQQGTYLARNSDFLVAIEKLYMNTLYHFLDTGYSFNGNTTAFIEMEDGVNEYGLAIGLTSVYPKQIQPGLNAGMLLRLFLETCKGVEDVIKLINQLPIASSQTFTLVDRDQNIACIECSCDQLIIHKPNSINAYVCATNRFHFDEMKNQRVDIEDDWFANQRWLTMDNYLKENSLHMNKKDVISLISNRFGFICKYDRKSGKDTVWSILYDAQKKELFRVEGNPARKTYQPDLRFKFKEDI